MDAGEAQELLTASVRDTVARIDGVQLALNGYLVVETLDVDQNATTLRYFQIGDPTPWAAAGMLRGAAGAVDRDLSAGYDPEG